MTDSGNISFSAENGLRKMRILSVRLGSYSSTGGIERACRDSDQILSGAGADLVVLSLWDNGAEMPVSRPGQRYYGCHRSKGLFLWRFFRILLAGRWDVVWIQHRLLAPLAGFVRTLTRARIVVWVFGWEVWSPPGGYARFCLNLADRVLAISTFTAHKCESLYRVSPVRMRICPLGVSQALHTCGGTPVAGIPAGPYVLVVSRLMLPAAEQKGVLRVCEAMAKVIHEVPAAFCVVAGEGPARREIEARVRALGLGDRVVFTGHLSDGELSWVYRNAAVFALPSTVEGFGLVYVEAMINRLPVVAGSQDAAIDVVKPGHSGLLVDPMDVAQIAAALIALLKDKELRVKMGVAGYERVQQEFTCQAMGRRLVEVFRELES